jgi:hypothetical protein
MSDWFLYTATPEAPTDSLVGYSVLDAVGVPLGSVSGWAYDGRRQLAGFRVAVRGFLKRRQHFLIPLGYVTQVDPRHRFVHLREITRKRLPDHAIEAEHELPPTADLELVTRQAPNVRPEIRSILEDPHRGPIFLRPGRLTLPRDQGDGAARRTPSVRIPPPTPLARASDPIGWAPLAPKPKPAQTPRDVPQWSSLASFRRDP